MRRRIATLAAAIVVATSGLVPAVASPAMAATCGDRPRADLDADYAKVVGTSQAGVNMRTGPWLNCGVVLQVPLGEWVNLYCWDDGTSVNGNNDWSYVRYGAYQGWVSEYYLARNGGAQGLGSIFHCTYY